MRRGDSHSLAVEGAASVALFLRWFNYGSIEKMSIVEVSILVRTFPVDIIDSG